MKRKVYFRFTLILFIVGFMVAVQYNTIKKPEQRDTRDVWDIRQELTNEKQRHSKLLTDIRSLQETVDKYDNLRNESPFNALNETIQILHEQAGLTEIKTPGVVLTVEPALEGIALGEKVTEISPDLLVRLVNEVNRFKGTSIEIDGKRMVQMSAIRDINGQTTVNSLPVKKPPFNIQIGTKSMEDAKKLSSHLQASTIEDEFYIDNLKLTFGEPQEKMTISGYDRPLQNNMLQKVPGGE